MKSEDIARYVAGLEEEHESASGALAREVDTACAWQRRAEAAEAEVERLRDQHRDCAPYDAYRAERDNAIAEVERLRAAQPALPDVGPVDADAFGGEDWELRMDIANRLACLRARETKAADPAPDTSRVTFGTRHEGTGMVLLQHADLPGLWWGSDPAEDAGYHLSADVRRAAHAALAEVREALNTAEAAGLDVHHGSIESPFGTTTCAGWLAWDDEPRYDATNRARRYLAREVQALVDQGLRGADLNARLPYEVRDHRAPVAAADTSSDDEDEAALIVEAVGRIYGDHQHIDRGDAEAVLKVLDAHRAARTSEEQS